MSRPEDLLPPELFYNETESRKYTTSSRIQAVQASMTYRALELLDLDRPSLILDVGCGSGLSGEILSSTPESDEEDDDDDDDNYTRNNTHHSSSSSRHAGPHEWVGMDISGDMLAVALQREVSGDLLLADMGQGVPFRAGSFDAAVSISAVQWLCNAESSDVSPEGRLRRFFDGLYAALRRGGRAVCQFYPRDDRQRRMVSEAAVRAGFGAGILEDDPGTKNVKLYLVLTAGGGDLKGGGGGITAVVRGMDGVDVMDGGRSGAKGSSLQQRRDVKKGSKAWIMHKKDQMERKGRVVKHNSKYTGRKRRIAF